MSAPDISDIKAAFERWHADEFGWINGETWPASGEYCDSLMQSRWQSWQAATEAAKATGTAGELPEPTHEYFDYQRNHLVRSGGFSADQMREYGQSCAEAARNLAIAQSDYNHDMDELAQDFEPVADMNLEKAKRHIVGLRKRLKNAKAKAEAARQPAPVVAVKTWRERREWDEYTYAEKPYAAIQARDEEIAELRAALAARSQPAPAMSDEAILEIARESDIFQQHDNACPSEQIILDFSRSILAAAQKA